MSDAARFLLRLRAHCEAATFWQDRLTRDDVWAFAQLRLQAAHVIGFMA